MGLSEIKKHFDEHGWVLIKNVFTETEVDQIREKVYLAKNRGHKGDNLSNPLIHEYVYDRRILDPMEAILGDKAIYFGDSTVGFNAVSGGFHKDNPDRWNQDAPDWQEPYGVIRGAIYLQNHVKDSGGLLLRDKSHNTTSLTEGKPFNVPIEKGDFVIWSLRTTHSGTAMLLKFFPEFIVNSKYYKIIPDFVFRKQKIERIGVFFTYGRKSNTLDRYIKYLKTRQFSVKTWQNSVYDPKVVAEAEKKGLTVIDMRPEVKDLKVEDLHEFHAEIPF